MPLNKFHERRAALVKGRILTLPPEREPSSARSIPGATTMPERIGRCLCPPAVLRAEDGSRSAPLERFPRFGGGVKMRPLHWLAQKDCC